MIQHLKEYVSVLQRYACYEITIEKFFIICGHLLFVVLSAITVEAGLAYGGLRFNPDLCGAFRESNQVAFGVLRFASAHVVGGML